MKVMLENHLKELKEKYLESLSLKMEKMRRSHQKGDWGTLRGELHKIKGTGLTYGFSDLSAVCRLFEQLVIGEKRDSFEKGFSLLEKILSHLQRNEIYSLQEDKDFLELQAYLPKEENKKRKTA